MIMDVEQDKQQPLFRGVDMLHKSETDHMSTNITESSQDSITSHTSAESTEFTLSERQPPIRIKVQTRVELKPLTWDEVSTMLTLDACSKCWAGNEKDEAAVSV